MTTLLAAALLPEVAHAIDAADVVMDSSALFGGSTVSWAPNGFGSPVVTWDPSLARWHAVMEYQTSTVDTDCPHGVWGLAWSTTTAADGASGWTTPVQIVTPPRNGNYYSCVAAHPAALSVETTSTLLGIPVGQALNVYFKAESETTTTACTTPGANQQNCVYTGIGRARVSFLNTVLFGYYFTSTSVGGTPMIPLAGIPFGFQSPIRLSGPTGYVMQIQRSGAIWQSTSTNGTTWTAPALKIATTAVAGADEWFNPDLGCAPTSGTIESYAGWRDWGTNPVGTISNAGLHRMSSTDRGVTWTLDPAPVLNWTNQTDWRHWSTTRVGPDDYLFFVTRKNAGTGDLELWRATALGTGTFGTPVSRTCP